MTPQEWLNSDRDYATGIEILRSRIKNQGMLRMMMKGPSKWSVEKMNYEMEKLCGSAGAAEQPSQPENATLKKKRKQRRKNQ